MLKVLILCSFFRIPEKLVRVSDVSDKNNKKQTMRFFHESLVVRTIVSNEAFFGVWGGVIQIYTSYTNVCACNG